jgi:phenylacetate-coenzyme A ligase PaaK-like adenylate-forming protein
VLISEVEPGKVYEPVITNFYGMPLMRYRQGDLLRFVMPDGNANLVPRIQIIGRADDTIDVFGISRINTVTVAQALEQSGLSCDDWFLKKEFESGKMLLRLYIELDGSIDAAEMKRRFSRGLKLVDRHWAEAIFTMRYNPLEIKLLPPGTFRRLHDSHKMVHINPPDSTIQEINGISKGKS